MRDHQIDKRALILIIVLLGQTLLFIVMSSIIRTYSNGTTTGKGMLDPEVIFSLFVVGALVLTGMGTWLTRAILDLSDKQLETKASAIRLQESQELIDVLRAHRHDYINHLQVISGLMDINQPIKAKAYINDLVHEIRGDQGIKLVDHPELNALLVKKWAIADSCEVATGLRLEGDLQQLAIPLYDMTRIIGNLLENAIQAATGVPDMAERKVFLDIAQQGPQWVIKVCNLRPVIPDELLDKVFQRGFTTKGDNGSGLGLDIVRSLVEKHNGSVALTSNNQDGTIFTVKIPKDY